MYSKSNNRLEREREKKRQRDGEYLQAITTDRGRKAETDSLSLTLQKNFNKKCNHTRKFLIKRKNS